MTKKKHSKAEFGRDRETAEVFIVCSCGQRFLADRQEDVDGLFAEHESDLVRR